MMSTDLNMAGTSGVFSHAVVVCTRNRPDDVRRLMDGLGRQKCAPPFQVLVVDASDTGIDAEIRQIVESSAAPHVAYAKYALEPSLARQRNYGVSLLPEQVNFVHFLDDDVTLKPGYLETLLSLLESSPDIGGVGGRVLTETDLGSHSRWKRLVSRIFLLESVTPGKVLPSGGQTGAQSVSLADRMDVQCLGGCASYRRELVDRLRFDERLEGYSMDEDLDFSYRVGRVSRLIVEPRARLVHHVSPGNRHSIRDSRRDLLVHRYWFVEKNIRHPLRKPAFWWKIFGSFLMTLLSRNPDAREARKGIIDGVGIVLKRASPLLSKTHTATP